jgi:glutamate racemase
MSDHARGFALAVGWVSLGWLLGGPPTERHAGAAEVALSPAAEAVVRHATESADGATAFTFAPADFRPDRDPRSRPIGVFDSGIGGLTVLEAILKLDAFDNRTLRPGPDGLPDFEHERFVYLGDQANMPYGNYPAAGNEAYLRELILKDVVFLLGRRFWAEPAATSPRLDKPPVKAIVIGCNTATAYGLDDIRAAISRWQLPVIVIGVVEAGARGVLAEESGPASGRDGAGPRGAIAVMATVGTCTSMAYPRAIAKAYGQAGRQTPSVVQQGSAHLAAAIEGDPTAGSVEELVAADVRSLMDRYRQSGATEPIDRIVLGCTHFPLVADQILEACHRLRQVEENGRRPFSDLIAAPITTIDPATLTAKSLFLELARSRLRAEPPVAEQSHRFFISVPVTAEGTPAAAAVDRPAGRLDVEDTRVVPMTVDRLPPSGSRLIRARLPTVWDALTPAVARP